MDNQQTQPLLLKPREAGLLIGYKKTTVYEMLKATPPQLPCIKIRGQYRIPRAALEEWIARQVREAEDAA
jgi:excisionase family DNA binding protein